MKITAISSIQNCVISVMSCFNMPFASGKTQVTLSEIKCANMCCTSHLCEAVGGVWILQRRCVDSSKEVWILERWCVSSSKVVWILQRRCVDSSRVVCGFFKGG